MSKKIFSAPYWENAPSKQEASLPALQTHDTPKTTTDLATDIDRVVQEIEANGVDIAPDYGMWVNICFALADGLGERGRDFFHRVSRLHPDYEPANTDKQFTHCLNGRGSGVTIASFSSIMQPRLASNSITLLIPFYQITKMVKRQNG